MRGSSAGNTELQYSQWLRAFTTNFPPQQARCPPILSMSPDHPTPDYLSAGIRAIILHRGLKGHCKGNSFLVIRQDSNK